MSKFLDKTGLDTFWAKIKSTFQTLGNLVTAWGSTPSDTKYPSEKLVKDSLDGKLSYLDASYMRNFVAGDGWVKLADIGSIVRSNADINGAWEVILVTAGVGIWRESITLSVRFNASGAPQIVLFNRVYENVKKTSFEFCVKVIGLAGSGNSNVELWAKLVKGWYSAGIREVGALNIASKIKWNYYSYVSDGGSSKPVADAGNNIQVADPSYIGGDDFVKVTGGTMTGPLNGYLMSTRATMVGNEYNCLLNAKERGILTFTQSGSGQLTEAQVWGLFDGKIIPQYGTAIDPEDPYILTLDLSSFITYHCQVFSAFGWTCRYWEPLKFKVELYDTYNRANEWVTICDYSQTQYTGQHSGGGTASLFVKFGSGTVNPHTGETRGGMFKKIRITIWKGNESTNRWGISEIFFCYPENYSVYGGLHAYAADKATNAEYADKLSTARYLAVALGNTSTNTAFDGHVSVTNIKTTGTLGVGNGGTGATTANAAANNLLSALPDWTANPTDGVKLIRRDTAGGASFGQVTFLTVWNYIKGKISSVLGLSENGYTGNAATATAAQSGSALETAINGKVDKVTGKGLSTNDYTTTEKNKLAGIASGAEVNVQSDWNQTTTTADDYIKNKPTIPSGSQLVYDCGTGSTSTTDFDNAFAAFNAGRWVIINKDSKVYYCVGSYSGPGLRFKQLANEVSLLKVNTLTWTKGSAPTAGTQLEASLTGHTHSQYLTASDINGKMNTSGDNAVAPSGDGGNGATATLLNNLTGPNGLGDITSDNVLIPTTESEGNDQTKWYKRPLSKLWPWITSHTQTRIVKTSSDVYWGVGADSNHTIDLDYDGRTSSPKMGLWVRWASGSGNAKYMCECDASGNCTFNGKAASADSARYAYHEYSPGGGTAYWIKIGRVTSRASSGSAGGALTAIISSGFNTAGDDLSAQLIRVSIRSKGRSTNGVTIVGDNVTLGLKSVVLNADVRFAVHTVTDRTTSVDGIYDIYVERKGWQYVAVLELHNDDVERTYNSDTTKAISDTTNMTIFSPILPYAGSAVSATSATSATELRIPYGSGSVYLQIGVSGSGNYLELGTNMADGVMVSYAGEASQAAVAGRLGTTSVGSDSNPIYLNNGVPTACNWWVS